MLDKLHDEILGKDYIVADCCNNITGDEIIVNKVIEDKTENNIVEDTTNKNEETNKRKLTIFQKLRMLFS